MDINISANTLFHFTPEKKSLINILANGLYVRYSLENFESLIHEEAEIVFPMTCFCDIPLSQVKRHYNTYGKYAIGLSKSWGMENKVNPVIYTYPGSMTAEILSNLAQNIENFFDIAEEEWPKFRISKGAQLVYDKYSDREHQFGEKIGTLNLKLAHFIRFIKPYEGKFYRNGNYLNEPVRFYDEREWRFTPPKEFLFSKDLKDSYKKEYYINPIKRRAINMKLSKRLKLLFEPKDIRFIIVKSDKEIPEMLNQLEILFGNRASHNELKLLGTRLISLEQIIEDL